MQFFLTDIELLTLYLSLLINGQYSKMCTQVSHLIQCFPNGIYFCNYKRGRRKHRRDSAAAESTN